MNGLFLRNLNEEALNRVTKDFSRSQFFGNLFALGEGKDQSWSAQVQLNIDNLDSACQDLLAHGDAMAKTFEGFFSCLLKIRSRMSRVRSDVADAVDADVSECTWLRATTDGLTKVVSLPMTRLSSIVQMRDSLEQRLAHVREGFDLLRTAPGVAQPRMASVLGAQAKSIADTLLEISESSMRSCESLLEGVETATDQIPHVQEPQEDNLGEAGLKVIAAAHAALETLSSEIRSLVDRISDLSAHAKDLGADAAKMRDLCVAPNDETAPASLLAGLQELYTSDVEHEVHQAELQRNKFH